MAEQSLISPDEMEKQFWNIFIVGSLIGNFDRHNGNWGILINEKERDAKLAPIFDCGSCLYPKPTLEEMKNILEDQHEVLNRIYVFPTSAIKYNGEKINYFEFISSLQEKNCNEALKRIQPRIDLLKINNMIDDIPSLTDIQKNSIRQ